MSPDVPAARKVLSLLDFTVGKWLLPWTGGEENLEGAAIASCRPYASGGSCCIPGQTVPHHGTPGQCSSAPESSAAQVSSQGHLSMGLTLLCITTWQPTAGLPVWTETRENSTAARQPCAGMTGSRDKMIRIFFFFDQKQAIEARTKTGFAAGQCVWLLLLSLSALVLSNVA